MHDRLVHGNYRLSHNLYVWRGHMVGVTKSDAVGQEGDGYGCQTAYAGIRIKPAYELVVSAYEHPELWFTRQALL